MPKILRIINRLNIGGPTYNAAYLSKGLAPEFETLLVAGQKDETEGDSEFILKKMDIQSHLIHEMKREINFKSDYAAFKDLKKIIRDFKPDIVHTHMAKPGTIGRLAAIQCKVPVILHTFHGHYFHSYFSPVKTKLFIQIERYLAKNTAGIIAISEVQKQELSMKYKIASPEKTFVVPLGFDLSRFRENVFEKRKKFRNQYLVDDNEIAVGIIGRLVPIKNHQLFIDAWKFVLENTTKKVRAFIIGDGEDRQKIESYCRQLNISFNSEDNIQNRTTLTFTSWIKEIDEALAGLDIVALTSFNEGTPVSLIEAQAASKPIVSTNVGGIENVVIENETALLCDVNDTGKFSEILLKMIENEDLRNQFSIKGWENVSQKFHYTRLVNDMRTLYRNLLTKS